MAGGGSASDCFKVPISVPHLNEVFVLGSTSQLAVHVRVDNPRGMLAGTKVVPLEYKPVCRIVVDDQNVRSVCLEANKDERVYGNGYSLFHHVLDSYRRHEVKRYVCEGLHNAFVRQHTHVLSLKFLGGDDALYAGFGHPLGKLVSHVDVRVLPGSHEGVFGQFMMLLVSLVHDQIGHSAAGQQNGQMVLSQLVS